MCAAYLTDTEREVLHDAGRSYELTLVCVVVDIRHGLYGSGLVSDEAVLQGLVAHQQGHRLHRDRHDRAREMVEACIYQVAEHVDGFLRVTETTLGEGKGLPELILSGHLLRLYLLDGSHEASRNGLVG